MTDASGARPDSLVAERYRLQEQIGVGGMGVVWKAWDERLHRPVAIKRLHPHRVLGTRETALAAARAMREARITARLHHQHAVQVFDVVEQNGQPILVMQYVPSQSLLAVLSERGPLSPADVARIGAEVASALAAAHAAGIVHRDVTPGNILITEDGSAKISDFGISHALGDTTVTSTGVIVGTPAYLAPEVARGGPTTHASDVFSLGATLYTAAEGTPPFGTHENSMALLHVVASGRVEPPRRAGPLKPVLRGMLASDPDERPSMADVEADLMALAGDLSFSAPVGSPRGGFGSDDGARHEGAAVPDIPVVPDAPQAIAGPAGTEVLAAPAVNGINGGGPPDDQRRHESKRRSARRELVFAFIGVAAALAILLALVVAGLGESPRTGAPKTSRSQAPSTSGGPAPSEPSTSVSPTSPSPTRATPRPTSTSPRPVTGAPTATQLARAIADYYRLVPDDTDAGWSRLTASYQTTTAVSRQSYDSFWGAIQRVSTSNISGAPPRTAVATITYYRQDGRTIRERTSFGLVRDGGILKINTSHVLSSQQL